MYVGPGKSKDIDAIDFTLSKYSKLSPYNTKRTEVIDQKQVKIHLLESYQRDHRQSRQ